MQPFFATLVSFINEVSGNAMIMDHPIFNYFGLVGICFFGWMPLFCAKTQIFHTQAGFFIKFECFYNNSKTGYHLTKTMRMPWTLENIKAMMAAEDTAAALNALSFLIGARPASEREAFQWLAARYNGLLKRIDKAHLTEVQQQQEKDKIHAQLTAFLQSMEGEKAHPAIIEDEVITLTFISNKRNITNTFQTSPHRTVGALKEALIRQFKIDTSVPLDYDNPATYLVVNRTLLTNDRLSLREAGIKDNDIIQIDVQYHIRMIWNQNVPTRLRVAFIGKTFDKPSVIVNNVLIAKPISLTDDELEIEFYSYNYSDSIKDLLFNFRIIDGKECLEFQDVVNVKGKVIDLRKMNKSLPAGNQHFSLDR